MKVRQGQAKLVHFTLDAPNKAATISQAVSLKGDIVFLTNPW
jgi:hypothetical protein